MIATQPIAKPNREPTHEFIGEWRASGAIRGLPRWMVIANEDGTPSAKFLGLARVAFSLTPSISLTPTDQIINLGVDGVQDGTPTIAMRNAWNTWTS